MTGSPRPETGPATRLWLDPSFGASGDMMLGALVGLADDPVARGQEIADQLESLGLQGWSLEVSSVQRSSIRATRVEVKTGSGSSDHPGHRTWTAIDAMLAESELPAPVRTGARRTFRQLGEVEAGIHDVSIDEVHFHEVGAVDAIIDIVGAWLAWWALGPGDQPGPAEIVCGPIGLGSGSVEAAHGRLPLPAPATAELLLGAPITSVIGETVTPTGETVTPTGETVTPTGAALLATLADRWGPLPDGTLTRLARGAGGRNPATHPNVLSAYLVQPAGTHWAPGGGSGVGPEAGLATGLTAESSVEVTTNVDDIAPELVAYVIDNALAAGADDAWSTPITMKKGRSAVSLTVLCRPEVVGRIQELLMRETGSLGVRVRPTDKWVLDRSIDTVTVGGYPIRIKIGPFRAKPEYEDVAAAARALGRPFREVAAAAQAASFGQSWQSKPNSSE